MPFEAKAPYSAAEHPRSIRILELDSHRHVSLDVLNDLQESLKRTGMEWLGKRNASSIVPRLISKARLARRYGRRSQGSFFAGMMGPSESFLIPYCFLMEPIVYCFDCWQPQYPWWERFFRRHQIRTAFFSARQSAEYFRRQLPNLRAIWMPEAADPHQYDSELPLRSREIHALEIGRRYEWFHSRVTEHLNAAGRSHVHGEYLFATRQDLSKCLADSQISICFPRSITHPASAGNVETVTHRYFEAMASGCLIYGHCPEELRDLFGYDPVIAMDSSDPARQLLDILRHIDDYQGFVTRNLRRVREIGTWDRRAAAIQHVLNERRAFAPGHALAV